MFSNKILACLKAPGQDDDTSMEMTTEGLRCTETNIVYPYFDGVPSLLTPLSGDGRDLTERVKSFYEQNPFPNYEGLEEYGDLVTKGNSSPFANSLLRAIGYNKVILECGCGTGQLSHYLQLNNNHVLGIDMSLNSLELAIEHKKRNELVRSSFAQMNIFDLAIKDDAFDVVISHGVLHHTFDALGAFRHIVKKLRPEGIVVVGLYNRYARIPTWVRGKLIKFLGPRIDYVVRNRIQDVRKADVWIKDQYFNPHETWHTIDEVLSWFDENNIQYLNCYPPILETDGEDSEDLFASTNQGDKYKRLTTQISWLANISREGALFDVIGRKAV